MAPSRKRHAPRRRPLPIADRLELDERTVPLAQLLLTKLQIVRLNEKDLLDIWVILVACDVAEHDDDAVNAAYVARVFAGDWSLSDGPADRRDRARAPRRVAVGRARPCARGRPPGPARDAVALQALTRSRAAATIAATSGMSAA
jgi:hypothetical protein